MLRRLEKPFELTWPVYNYEADFVAAKQKINI